MIVFDVGNTNIVVGLFSKKKLVKTFRFKTKSKDLIKSLKKKLDRELLFKLNIKNKICVFCSVVPELNKKILFFLKKNNFEIIKISYLNKLINLEYKILKPSQLGNDRIVNSIAAIEKFGGNCLILDFGTATTFDIIKNKKYIGGIIAPGINVSHASLVQNASQLRRIL